jgi:hypothetical protein
MIEEEHLLDPEDIAAQDHRDSAVRVPVPCGCFAGSELQPSDDGRSAAVKDFFDHFNASSCGASYRRRNDSVVIEPVSGVIRASISLCAGGGPEAV